MQSLHRTYFCRKLHCEGLLFSFYLYVLGVMAEENLARKLVYMVEINLKKG